ncbi:MAG TPA: GntR family transcriptional regulator [Stellaceae bacterium]|jgi:DNA-binding GntR family transcriptional regulator|nr:GntR family transcriptional regulator [Stellaceae bacterium]
MSEDTDGTPAANAAKTRADRARHHLADEIITGTLKPGARLDECDIAERLGLSRTPVREALRQLAAIGLAELRPHRGVFVAQPDGDHLTEAFEFMADLESLCARYAATRMSGAERRLLEERHLSSGELVRRGDRESYAAHNAEFHELIYRFSHNRSLAETAQATRRRLAPYRRGQFAVLGRLALSYAEHERVLNAIIRGEATAAAVAMQAHVAIVSVASADYVAGRADGAAHAAG